jgi:hypothetical protein
MKLPKQILLPAFFLSFHLRFNLHLNYFFASKSVARLLVSFQVSKTKPVDEDIKSKFYKQGMTIGATKMQIDQILFRVISTQDID